jgi:hypothetical protein
MSDFDCIKGRIGFTFLRQLVASCLSFQMRLISLESEFSNSIYYEKYKERSNNNNSKRDSNSWTITDKLFVDERFGLY